MGTAGGDSASWAEGPRQRLGKGRRGPGMGLVARGSASESQPSWAPERTGDETLQTQVREAQSGGGVQEPRREVEQTKKKAEGHFPRQKGRA